MVTPEQEIRREIAREAEEKTEARERLTRI